MWVDPTSELIVQLGSGAPFALFHALRYKTQILKSFALKICIEHVCHDALFTTKAFQTILAGWKITGFISQDGKNDWSLVVVAGVTKGFEEAMLVKVSRL